MYLKRLPSPVLRPFVGLLWALDGTGTERTVVAARERVLPTGRMHLVFRLSGHPLRLYGGVDDPRPRALGREVVGGARSSPYLRDASRPSRSVGALLGPGAAELLFGVPSDELAERHTALEDLWNPSEVTAIGQRLLAADRPQRQLDLLEALLLARLPRVRGVHPAVAHALRRFEATAGVGEVVREVGYSHRWFIARFRRTVGLSPKRYCRVLRFQRALRRAAEPAAPWVEVALDAGYADQPHFSREFRELAGVTPGEYRSLAPPLSHHLPIR